MSSSKYFNSYCVLIIWILALAGSGSACSGGDEDKYRIVRKTDEGDKQLVVATEETAKMYCRTNVPWKKCWWKPPRNGVRQVSTLDILFSSNHNIHKSSCGLYFWASDPLIDRFSKKIPLGAIHI